MTTWFITRHPGARQWAESAGLAIDCHCSHLDPAQVRPGDTVIGTLPVQIAARICERGGRYQHLTLDLPENLRGVELSADDMRTCRARLEEFHLQRSSVAPPAKVASNLHVVLASGETLPNLIPAVASPLKANRVLIPTSDAMQESAERLKRGLIKIGRAHV